MTVDKLK